MKYYRLILLGLIVAAIAAGLFWFDKLIEPVLPSYISSKLLQIIAYVLLAITFLTGIKDVFELIDRFIGNATQANNLNQHREYRFELLKKSVADKVRAIWLDGFLENSLHETVMLELGLASLPGAVRYPWELIVKQRGYSEQLMQPGAKVINVLYQFGGSLLILGEPGSGKTITLLALARDLYDEYKKDNDQPIPIVLNLSSWKPKHKLLMNWIAQEASLIYRVNKETCWRWFNSDSFYLLLDGLDEVPREYQISCIKAINLFHDEYGLVNMVVSSRTSDYNSLNTKLNFPGAIEIQPLSQDQINRYLTAGGKKLNEAKVAIQRDKVLTELSKSPLALSIIALTYQHRPLRSIQSGTIDERRNNLFRDYIDVMFERKFSKDQFPKEVAISTLSWLAKQMSVRGNTLFFIEHLLPNWLPTQEGRLEYLILSKFIRFIFCIIFGYVAGLLLNIEDQGAVVGLIVGILSLLLSNDYEIKTIEKLNLPKKTNGKTDFSPLTKGVMIGGFIAAFVSAYLMLFMIVWEVALHQTVFTVDSFLSLILAIFLISVLFVGLLNWIEFNEVEKKTTVNQGIWLSVQNAVYGGLAGGLIAYVLGSTIMRSSSGAVLSIFTGLSILLLLGGNSVIKHLILRFMLYRHQNLPLRLETILNQMSKLIIMRRVGGGYIFIHRTLLEYFATLLPIDQQKEIIKSYQSSIESPSSALLSLSGRTLKLILDYTITITGLILILPR